MTYPQGSAYRRSAPVRSPRGSQPSGGYPRGGRAARPVPMAPHPMSRPSVPGRSGVPRIPMSPALSRGLGRLPLGMLIPLIGDIWDRLNHLDPQRSKIGLVDYSGMPSNWSECPGPGRAPCIVAGSPGFPFGFIPRAISPTHWSTNSGTCTTFLPEPHCYNNQTGLNPTPLPVNNWGGGRIWFYSVEGSQVGWTRVAQFVRQAGPIINPGAINPSKPGVPNYMPNTATPPLPSAPGWLDPDPVGVPVGDPLPDIAPPVRWSTVRRPVPWRAPSEQTQWGPLPAPRPAPLPEIAPGLQPSTPGVPGVKIEIAPGSRVVTAAAASPRKPPGPGVKERKVRLSGGTAGTVYMVASKIFGHVTEYEDFIDAFFKSIPKKSRPKCKTLQCKVGAVYQHWDKIDMAEALGRVLLNEVQDMAFGHIGNRLRSATQNNPYYRGGTGLQSGGQFVQGAIRYGQRAAGWINPN